ncbi:MAG: TrkH family potassium uptake protein, partial [Gemmatimonadetes bacterium]|nr:TrkH family potassium uptake protein [Gemmatimonadota bacterium]
MRFRHLVHIVSIILIALAVPLAAAAFLGLVLRDGSFPGLMGATVISASAGFTGFRLTSLTRDLSIREGYAVVSLSWIAIGIVGAVPYLLSGTIADPIAALFESVSGFTTTGATVFTDIEALPHGILFWRALTQWIGGMGIIVLGVAILPFLGVGGMQLFQAEVPGPTPERLAPRITQTAKLLWLVYAGLTVVQAALYVFGGMSVFDAITHAFTTMSTGGFSTRNASIAAYDSAWIDWVTIVFMYVAGINFTLHWHAVSGKPRRYFDDAEWRTYTFLMIASSALIAAVLFVRGGYADSGLGRAVRDAVFQAISIGTTTGYVSADWELWPYATQMLLFLLMFVGGMAGSTAGGMKTIRFLAFHRHGLTWMRRSIHPRAVVLTRIGRRALHDEDLLDILAFALLFLVLFVAGAFALTVLGHDLVTSLGASASAIGNIGPGLGDVGA